MSRQWEREEPALGWDDWLVLAVTAMVLVLAAWKSIDLVVLVYGQFHPYFS